MGRMNIFTLLRAPHRGSMLGYSLIGMLGLNENVNLRHYCVSRQL